MKDPCSEKARIPLRIFEKKYEKTTTVSFSDIKNPRVLLK